MDRLTGKDELGYYVPRNQTLYCLKQRGEITDRLAAYEDTGLTPEEIRVMLKKIDDVHRRVEKIDPKTLEHLSYLVDAEEQGRLIVLPCKVGDTVWMLEYEFNGKTLVQKVKRRMIDGIGGNSLNPVWMVSEKPFKITFHPSEFGKTVFLTREEAARALGGEE